MKKYLSMRVSLIASLICLLTVPDLRADDSPSFDGDWIGFIKVPERADMTVRIKIEGDKFTQFFKSEEDWQAVTPHKSYFEKVRDIAIVGWVDSGGVWSENQMFSLSYMNSRN